jgi:hypothetical protein
MELKMEQLMVFSWDGKADGIIDGPTDVGYDCGRACWSRRVTISIRAYFIFNNL